MYASCGSSFVLETPHGSKLDKGFGYYKYHNHGKNWFAAKKECEKEGAHLAIINSAKERDLLLKIYKEKPAHGKNPAIFIGINDLVQDGTWVTVFGKYEPLDKTGFADWNRSEPSGKTKQNCGALQAKAGKLHDHECAPGIQLLDIPLHTSTLHPDAGKIRHQLRIQAAISWSQLPHKGKGVALYSEYTPANKWIRDHQDIPLSQTGYSRWDTSQPDNGENGNCGTLRTTTGKLHDIACTATLGFYCELEV
ncbi:hypothetical protein C0J52_15830 [Blattella germanica]|nr:hypothetical protein C0J52_15830 [Blattella germanica]